MIDWVDFRKTLRKELSEHIIGQNEIRVIVQDVGLSAAKINFNDKPENIWHAVIDYAKSQQAVLELIREAQQWLPRNETLAALAQKWTVEQIANANNARSPALKQIPVADTTREKQMGSVPTFLPAVFLEAGAAAASSVVRVRTPNALGTGFLISRDILLTNHHVISSVNTAKSSEVDFDYQADIDGTFVSHTTSKIDPACFHTSQEHDITAVRINLPDSINRTPLTLSDESVRVNDRVAIIQHPDGGRKQVALHRNFVLYADDQILQYLTDTLPGSSGSPIFDRRWRVVGIHHSGGQLLEPKTQNLVYRNQGTALKTLRNLLDEWKVLP